MIHMTDLKDFRPADPPTTPERVVGLACLILSICLCAGVLIALGGIKS